MYSKKFTEWILPGEFYMVTYLMCTFMHLESRSKNNNFPSRTHLVPRLVVSTEQVLNEDRLCKLSSLFTMVAMAVYIIYFYNFSLQLICNVMQRNQVLC